MTTSAPSRHRSVSGREPRREPLLMDFAVTPVSPADRRRAALAVCARSANADEARGLLEALGLLDDRAVRGAA
ncbi:MAG TPA: hypothetical protein VG708_09895 [Mycobacteriales bacterium]|nr:hypothetical protein [Mycobacteriales bacterium]